MTQQLDFSQTPLCQDFLAKNVGDLSSEVEYSMSRGKREDYP